MTLWSTCFSFLSRGNYKYGTYFSFQILSLGIFLSEHIHMGWAGDTNARASPYLILHWYITNTYHLQTTQSFFYTYLAWFFPGGVTEECEACDPVCTQVRGHLAMAGLLLLPCGSWEELSSSGLAVGLCLLSHLTGRRSVLERLLDHKDIDLLMES